MKRDDDLVNMMEEQMEQVGDEERWCEADAHGANGAMHMMNMMEEQMKRDSVRHPPHGEHNDGIDGERQGGNDDLVNMIEEAMEHKQQGEIW